MLCFKQTCAVYTYNWGSWSNGCFVGPSYLRGWTHPSYGVATVSRYTSEYAFQILSWFDDCTVVLRYVQYTVPASVMTNLPPEQHQPLFRELSGIPSHLTPLQPFLPRWNAQEKSRDSWQSRACSSTYNNKLPICSRYNLPYDAVFCESSTLFYLYSTSCRCPLLDVFSHPAVGFSLGAWVLYLRRKDHRAASPGLSDLVCPNDWCNEGVVPVVPPQASYLQWSFGIS